jgi:peptide/nickel transport system permease protein
VAVQAPAISQLAPTRRQSSRRHETTHRFFQSGSAVAGLSVILAWILVALFATLIAGDPYAQDPLIRLQPPSSQHPFGTDELGRDVFSRVLHGARISLPVGVVVIAFSAVLGSLLGAVAGFAGGKIDEVIMRVVDVVLAFPSIVLAMAIAAVLGPSLVNAVIAIIVVWWPEYARMMRGQVLAAKENEYILAARALGVPERRVLLRHILPGAISPILVKASLDIGSAVVFIASLSFIGLGVVPPTPEWGAMIAAGRVKFFDWWLATFPGLAIVSVVLAFNYVGDGLRDALDPRLRRR